MGPSCHFQSGVCPASTTEAGSGASGRSGSHVQPLPPSRLPVLESLLDASSSFFLLAHLPLCLAGCGLLCWESPRGLRAVVGVAALPAPPPAQPAGPIVQSGKLRLGPTVMSKQALFLSYLADILPSIMKFPLLFPCSRVMLRRPGTVVGLAGGPLPAPPLQLVRSDWSFFCVVLFLCGCQSLAWVGAGAWGLG